MPVDLQQLQENISEDIRCKSIFLSLHMFLPEDVSHIFTAALCLCFPLPSHPCLYLMCSTIQPLDTVCFERQMRGNDSFIRQGSEYKSHLTCWSDGWYCRSSSWRVPGTLIRAFSGAWCMGHHLSCSDSVWQQTQAGLTSENVHIAPPNSNVKPDKELQDDSGIWGLDRPVRGVIIFHQKEIWIWPQVCVFLFLWANVSHQSSAKADIYTHQNFCDCFGLAISKCCMKEDEWGELSVVLKMTFKDSSVRFSYL